MGLILALIFAVSMPELGIICKQHYGVEISVIAIFVVSGYVHKFSEVQINKKLIILLLLSTISNNLSIGIIACVMYHFMQILFDSVLASFVSKRKNKRAMLKI